MAVAFTLLITMKKSFNAKLDTHVDTHTCEKIRKNAVKYICYTSLKTKIKIPAKQLTKPFGGDFAMVGVTGFEPAASTSQML